MLAQALMGMIEVNLLSLLTLENLKLREDLTVFCRVNNVFDRSFATVAFSGGFFPAPGRQVLVGGKYEF